VFFSSNFIDQRRPVAERFMRAYIRGIRDYLAALKDGRIAGTNAAEIIAILTKYTTIKDASLYARIVPSSADRTAASIWKPEERPRLLPRPGLVKDDKIASKTSTTLIRGGRRQGARAVTRQKQ